MLWVIYKRLLLSTHDSTHMWCVWLDHVWKRCQWPLHRWTRRAHDFEHVLATKVSVQLKNVCLPLNYDEDLQLFVSYNVSDDTIIDSTVLSISSWEIRYSTVLCFEAVFRFWSKPLSLSGILFSGLVCPELLKHYFYSLLFPVLDLDIKVGGLE